MKDSKILFVVLLSVAFAFCAKAQEPFVFDNFESYVVGMEGTYEDGDLELVWWHFPPDTCYLNAYVDDVVKCSGSKSMRLESPLKVGGSVSSTGDWGVNYGFWMGGVDVTPYNVVTAMIRIPAGSSITTCSLVVRDQGNVAISHTPQQDYSVEHDGQWHKIRAVLDGAGDKYYADKVLLFFGITPGVSEAIPQMWVDDIKFERVPEVNDFLQIDVNGPAAHKGSKVKYSFVMKQQPTANVTFTIDPNSKLNFGNGYGVSRTLLFTPADWNIRQEITVDVNGTGYDYHIPSAIVSFVVDAESADLEINDALPLKYDVKIYGKYSAPYVISSDTPTQNWYIDKDDSGFDLANGHVESTWYYPVGIDWVEWYPFKFSAPAYAEITFDLESVKDVNTIDITSAGYQSNMYPGSFSLSYSTDNVTFTDDPTVYEAYAGAGLVATTHLEVNAKSVRYVKLRVHCFNDDPSNAFYLSEVQFNVPADSLRPYPRYTYDPATKPLGSSNKDVTGTDLMNGAMNVNTDFVYFVNASGQPYGSAILYADYGKVREFSSISLNYYYYTYAQSSSIQKVKLSFSYDGVNYGTPIEVTGWDSTSGNIGKTDSKTFAPQTGQYVKIEIVGNGTKKLIIGEVILSNRVQMTYEYDTSTPVWGGTGAQGDIAWGTLTPLRFGDLANTHIPLVASAYSDADWVEWAPGENSPATPAYGIITFDLKSSKLIKNVAVTYGLYPHDDPAKGIEAPENVEVAFSTNGTTFTSYQTTVGDINNNSGGEHLVFTTVLGVPTPTNARYVKVKINCQDNNPNFWLYIAEVKFNVFAGDINDDGVVNFKDLRIMASQWLETGTDTTTPSADIAGNGRVNFEDFAKLAMQWLY